MKIINYFLCPYIPEIKKKLNKPTPTAINIISFYTSTLKKAIYDNEVKIIKFL